SHYPSARIDFLLRKGNENLLAKDPRLHEVLIWDKKKAKYRELFRLLKQIRNTRYDLIVNVQRFASMGFLTALSGARLKVGFKKNPFAFAFDIPVRHELDKGIHETERNLALIRGFTDDQPEKPSLILDGELLGKVAMYKSLPYLTIAPTSVWHTKQLPAHKWADLLKTTTFKGPIYLLGAPSDFEACEEIRKSCQHPGVINLCGKLSLMESAALMKDARMNFVNDSAPMHFCSAVNAPVTAVFCSTVPSFGFGPLSDDSAVIEAPSELNCRPCGLHGHAACPHGHFACAETIDIIQMARRAEI
ncbi:MAG: glycosyltransferase family 9 protein, partial [Cyclobacteriaceae bacterium]|nr:glycosyltransferase family 9 protein [Cyclobacteriaceae bacterium]